MIGLLTGLSGFESAATGTTYGQTFLDQLESFRIELRNKESRSREPLRKVSTDFAEPIGDAEPGNPLRAALASGCACNTSGEATATKPYPIHWCFAAHVGRTPAQAGSPSHSAHRIRRSSSPTRMKTNAASSFPVLEPTNIAGNPYASLMSAVFDMSDSLSVKSSNSSCPHIT
jgi:hypothetical protein